MLKSKTQRLTTAALFVAIGLILPYFTSHALGMPGTLLLPMHIPVLLCGLICGPQLGAFCGIIIPVLSSVLTGMPAAYPMLPIMTVQLLAMGLVGGLLYQRVRLNIYLSLIITMLSGWALYGLVFAVLMLAGNGELRALSVTAAIVQGLPGIGIQLILIPAVVTALKRLLGRGEAKELPPQEMAAPPSQQQLDEALALIASGEISCVVIRGGEIIHTADGRGVSPLLRLYESEPEKLKGAFIVDKIIGKAAAMILVLGGASGAYGLVMSMPGRRYLEERGTAVQYARCVEVISNRTNDGICPIERSVIDTEDPQEGLRRMKGTIKELMSKAI